jgi:ubiquitin-protein ligase
VKLSPRARRLISDAQNMQKRFQACDWIRIREMTGEPADTYTIEYRVASLEHGKTPDKPLPRSEHRVEIKLTADYPRAKPLCRMLTPIFHPNIDTSTICVGDHWTAGERLADLVIRIGEMLAYQAYNIQSPLDAEAAMWADLNQSQLPLDTRNLHPPEP